MRPGVNVTVIDTTPPRSQILGVDPFFVIGLAEKGPTAPALVRNMSEFELNFGTRVSYGTLYDIIDAYFKEGGTRAYVSRVVGAAAVKSSLIMNDNAGTPAPTVKVSAVNAGVWGDALRVAVTGTAGVSVKLVVSLADGTLLETSPAFTSRADMIAWAGSQYVTVTAQGSSVLLPNILAATALAGGSDDRAAIVDATYTAALAMFGKALGSGQIAIPGINSLTIQAALLTHAYNFNRVALIDAPDSTTASTLTSAASALRADVNARYGAMFGPKVTIPGLIPGTTREMWATVIVAALMARLKDPSDAAAGVKGESRLALGVKYEYTDTERETLNTGSVNILRPLYGAVRNYGYRSLANPDTLPGWTQFSAARTVMGIKSQSEEIAERHVFAKIDGKGIEFSTLNGELSAMLSAFYRANALYGDTPEEAFLVDTGPTVNTPTSIIDGQIKANLFLRVSPFGEIVNLQIIKAPLPTTTGPAPLAAIA